MRYAPPGLCLNDFDLSRSDDDEYHLLHLQGPWTAHFDERSMETSYGHAVSDDLVNWEPLGPAFGVGMPGRFDEDAIWTMHTMPLAEGATVMAYTGVQTHVWAHQAIGLAYTDRVDATGWRRVCEDPIVTADPRWYREGPGMAWRDPFLVRDRNQWMMTLCASDAALPADRAGCVGLATSPDLINWTVHPPLLSPGAFDELECPILHRTRRGWLLLGSHGAGHRIHAWTATGLEGPWRDQGPLGPAGPYAPRITTGPHGETLLLHTVQRRTRLRNAGRACRGLLAQPKLLDLTTERPRLRWWPALESQFASAPSESVTEGMAELEFAPGTRMLLHGLWDSHNLVLERDEHALTLTRDGHTVGSCRLSPAAMRVRVLFVGEYIEIYAEDEFALTAADYLPRTAPELRDHQGRAQLVGLRAHHSTTHRDDVSALLRSPADARRRIRTLATAALPA